MTRNGFNKKLIKLGLLALLVFVSLALKNRIVTGKNCSGCPVNGVCNGKVDCDNY